MDLLDSSSQKRKRYERFLPCFMLIQRRSLLDLFPFVLHSLKLRENENQEDTEMVETSLLPICRGLATNWRHGNRREAGVALAHITGSGKSASDLVGAMSRLLKKVLATITIHHCSPAFQHDTHIFSF